MKPVAIAGRFLLWSIVATASLSGAELPPLLTNGAFEAKDQGGWYDAGQKDGSHGVFSDPSRPGTHSYLLQLAGGPAESFSSISQVLNLEKGAVYRLQLDVWRDCFRPTPKAQGRLSAVLDDALVFDRDLCLAGADSGWTSVSLLFRAAHDHPSFQIRLTGQGFEREASTTAIDQVTLEKTGTTLPPALLPGKPLTADRQRKSLPLALGFATPPSMLSLQGFRDRFGQTPALAAVDYSWQDPSAPALWPGLSAWVQHGVVPIVSIPITKEELPVIAVERAQERWRQFAAEARKWRYPLLLRLAPAMDLNLAPDQSTAFVAFWKSLHQTFREADARNVTWFWTPSRLGPSSHPFYPGDAFVDFVGFSILDPDWSTAIQENLDQADERYPDKAVAVADSSGPPPSPKALLRSFRELRFFTIGDRTAHLPNAGSADAAAIAEALQHPSTSPGMPQVRPPLIETRLVRNGPRLTISVIDQDPCEVSPADRVRLEVWNGHPFLGGSLVKTYN